MQNHSLSLTKDWNEVNVINRPFPSCLLPLSKRVFVRNYSYENEFSLQVHFHANQTHFHMKGFGRSLVLKQRPKVTRNWSITAVLNALESSPLTIQEA